MSNVYSMEPRTNCKINLNTTYGILSVELWGKECPLACRNFIQLCLEGYYDQSFFHRLVPGFCLQGGKPSKTFDDEQDDEGMAAIQDGKFPIETHSRLKFNRRGLLGMVALDSKGNEKFNRSQFFFTLAEAPELNGNSTLFGRIVGDTVFNLLRMGELETDPKTDSLLYPPQIINTEVIINPFNDIVPRERKFREFDSAHIEKVTVNSIKTKNYSLLSFSEPEMDPEIMRKEYPNNKTQNTKNRENAPKKSCQTEQSQSSPSTLQFLQKMKAAQMRESEQKIKSIELELGFRSEKKCQEETGPTGISDETTKNMTALERHKLKFIESKKRKSVVNSSDETETLFLLNSFRQKIQKNGTVPTTENLHIQTPKKHLDICKLHGLLNCLSCKNNFNINLNTNTADYDEKDWLMHKLVFDRRELEGQVREDLKELVVIDPRDQIEKASKNISRSSKNNQ